MLVMCTGVYVKTWVTGGGIAALVLVEAVLMLSLL